MARIPDRVKQWAVFGLTEVLPKRLRLRARNRLLTALEIEKAERAGLIIIGHPMSGKTRLRVQISRLYQVRHGLPPSLIARTDELHRTNRAIPCILSTSACYSYERTVGVALAAGAPDSPLRHKPIVFLARNPCDVVVSWYTQVTKRQSRQTYELINAELEHALDRRTISMWDFVRHSELGIEFVIEYLNTWERNVRRLDRAIIVRYEDLRADPGRELRRVAALIGETFTDAEFEEAVRFGSHENLRELEAHGFFRNGGMTLRSPSDPQTIEVRRARAGGHREDLTADQIAELEDLMARRLTPTLRYARASG